MRTYRLQDGGLDTFDANATLGFDDDERDYGIAARMLQILSCSRILLLTNNPAKLDGLTRAGIEVAARVPLEAPDKSLQQAVSNDKSSAFQPPAFQLGSP
jgi:GTP cyclohydrolase II